MFNECCLKFFIHIQMHEKIIHILYAVNSKTFCYKYVFFHSFIFLINFSFRPINVQAGIELLCVNKHIVAATELE